MLRIKQWTFILFVLLLTSNSFAQKAERQYIRKGNKLYNDSVFVKAEVDYRKALEVNSKSVEGMYNLGNSLYLQQKGKEAIEQYQAAANIEKEKTKRAQIYHNMGVVLQSAKQYPQCIEAYKQALRNNPKDDETRYNLALAQKLLKDQQQNQDQNKDNKDEQKKEQEKKEQEQQNQDKKKEQKDQPKPQEPKENEMSKENAQQLLDAAAEDEKETQEKVKKVQQLQGRKLEKDW